MTRLLAQLRYLIDLLLMEALVTHDYAALREACELVFGSRNTHAWPPDLDANEPPPLLHPSMAELYRTKVQQLAEAPAGEDARTEASDAPWID
jgi:hypothetical protein